MNELETARLRFYRLANGLMAVVYITAGVWLTTQVLNMIF